MLTGLNFETLSQCFVKQVTQSFLSVSRIPSHSLPSSNKFFNYGNTDCSNNSHLHLLSTCSVMATACPQLFGWCSKELSHPARVRSSSLSVQTMLFTKSWCINVFFMSRIMMYSNSWGWFYNHISKDHFLYGCDYNIFIMLFNYMQCGNIFFPSSKY